MNNKVVKWVSLIALILTGWISVVAYCERMYLNDMIAMQDIRFAMKLDRMIPTHKKIHNLP
jgi:hypothetical protein